MYMVQQLEKGTVYNMPILFAIEGDIEPERIEETFQKLVNRHESLRTYFVDVDGEIVQKSTRISPLQWEEEMEAAGQWRP